MHLYRVVKVGGSLLKDWNAIPGMLNANKLCSQSALRTIPTATRPVRSIPDSHIQLF
jgi:hypothetical protein